MVTLTSYFVQPYPCQFPLDCKRNSHQIQQETSQKFDWRRFYLDYSTKFQQFRSFVKYCTLLHDVSCEQSPLVGLFAHANFSNMKDANDSAQIILKATMMPERNLYSKGIHDDSGNKNVQVNNTFFLLPSTTWNFLMPDVLCYRGRDDTDYEFPVSFSSTFNNLHWQIERS